MGYIGLPTSAVIASTGTRVVGVDVASTVVDAINAGRVPIVEPDLDEAVADVVSRGLLTASVEVPEADAYLIAVPTPFEDDNRPDLTFIKAATRAIAPRLRGGEVVILESTSPPGTTRMISELIATERPDLRLPHAHPDDPEVHIAHCPERVLPGQIMREMITNDRIVGGLTPECTRRAAKVYELFCTGQVVHTDAESAEMAKLAENSFRDVNIAFANELANVCDHLDLNVWEIIRLANHHPRVNILNPGPGVGGHCIAVDPWFIVSAAPDQAQIIRRARHINDARPGATAAKIHGAAADDDLPIACLGLTFKANVDDVRHSPAIQVTAEVARQHPDRAILAVEPHIGVLPPELAALPNIELTTLPDALARAGTLALLVDHHVFMGIDESDLINRPIVDTRGVWNVNNQRHS